jgi:hypothetical protein
MGAADTARDISDLRRTILRSHHRVDELNKTYDCNAAPIPKDTTPVGAQLQTLREASMVLREFADQQFVQPGTVMRFHKASVSKLQEEEEAAPAQPREITV